MRVLQFHNTQLNFGGADVVLENEQVALRDAGHEVLQVLISSSSILAQRGGLGRAAATAVWNADAHQQLDLAVEDFKPDLIHFHTVFPLASPAVLRVATDHEIPSVMTHHSYRVSCVNSMLLRDGKSCTDCVGKRLKWNAVANQCYRSSLGGSTALATSLLAHKALRSWDGVTVHIALSEFGRNVLQEEFGPDTPIVVSPNFIVGPQESPYGQDPQVVNEEAPTEKSLLFLGRLTHSKGILEALHMAAATGVPLAVAGDGPLRDAVETHTRQYPNISYLGSLHHSDVGKAIRSHAGLLFASVWPEACPMSILETYAENRPVLAPDSFQYGKMIKPGVTGEHYSDHAADFHEAASRLLARSQAGYYHGIRDHFETLYSPQAGLARLEDCYSMALDLHS